MPMKKIKVKTKEGFSIMEVMLSAFVLVVGIVAAIALIANSIKHSIDSRGEVIAAQLAQEGAELMRNIRDNNFISDPAEPFKGFSTNGDICMDSSVDTKADPSLSYSCASYKLYYNNTSSYYTRSSSGASLTKFSRKITIAGSASPPGKTITSKVWWGTTEPSLLSCTTASKCVSAQSILTDWQ